jgi:hypothetical protein
LILIIVYGQSWPWFISTLIIISLLCAGIINLYSVCGIKALIWLPKGNMALQFKNGIKTYDQIIVCHQGPQLIILQCKNAHEQRYVLGLADAFTADDFGLLQRLLKSKEW